jgi:hypothetical protein
MAMKPEGKEFKRNAAILRNHQSPVSKSSHVETPEGEDINSLSVGHSLPRQGGEKEIFTHLLESRKEVKPSSFSSEMLSSEKSQMKRKKSLINHPPNKTCPALAPSAARTNHQINTQNPNKITYATSTRPIPDPGRHCERNSTACG